ncbi:hypothetical protein ScPMuIL_012677 [Solemya velum]
MTTPSTDPPPESRLRGFETYDDSGFENLTCPIRNVSLSDHHLPKIALASFPRSGNSWTRHLLQQLSGIGAGSVYCSDVAKDHGFPLECYTKRVIVVKTHEPNGDKYDKAVVVIRNPFLALFSVFQFMRTGGPFKYVEYKSSKMILPSSSGDILMFGKIRTTIGWKSFHHLYIW